jgi:hypothetical protein
MGGPGDGLVDETDGVDRRRAMRLERDVLLHLIPQRTGSTRGA